MTWQKIRIIIIPSFIQVVCCLLMSFALFGIVFAADFGTKIISNVAQTSGVDQQTITLSYHQQLAAVSNNAVANAVSFLVMIVAVFIIIALIMTSFRRTLLSLRDELVVAETDVADVVKKRQARIIWQPILKPVLHSLVIISVVVFVFFSIQQLLPLWLALFGTLFTLRLQFEVVIAVVVAVAGLTVNIYSIWTLAQIAVAMR